jgi:hypothetical protein
MVSAKSMGTSNVIKEQYGKHKKFLGGVFYSLPLLYTSALNSIKTENLIKRYYLYEISRKKSYKK